MINKIAVPFGEYVVLERVCTEASNLIVPDALQSEDYFDLVVVDIGDAVTLELKVGDTIIVGNERGFQTEQTDHFMMHQSGILGKYRLDLDS